jgi:hypothetical protein
MKLQIIELEPQDDRAALQDALAGSQASRVVFVVPNRGPIRLSRLDWVLIRRQARVRGAQLGIVTRHPAVAAAAHEALVPVFDTMDQATSRPWPGPPAVPSRADRPASSLEGHSRPPTKARRISRTERIAWGALVLGVWIVAIAVILPHASVVVEPIQAARTATLMLDLSTQRATGAPTLVTRQIETSLSGQLRVPASGTTDAPLGRAAGTVVFTNLADEQEVVIPAGTSVRASSSPGQRFTTKADAQLPAGRGEAFEAPVEAVAAGAQGNLDAGTIDTIDGPVGLLADVTNLEAFSGGSSEPSPAVADADLSRLRRGLTEQLLLQAQSDLLSGVTPEEMLVPGSIRTLSTVEESFDRTVGERAESLGLDLTLEVGGLAVGREQVQRAAQAMVLDLAEPGWSARLDSLVVTGLATSSPSADRLTVDAQWQEYREPDRAGLAAAARGLPRPLVAEELERQFSLVAPPSIQVWPAWLPWMPLLDSRIAVWLPWENG